MGKILTYSGKVLRLFKELKSLYRIIDTNSFLRYCTAILTNLPAIIKKKSIAPVREKMEGRNCVSNVFGRSVVLDGKYFGRITELYARKVYFVLPEFRLNENMVVVDLGADIGAFTVLAALIAKKVIAVEAVFSSLEELKENARQNHCLNKVKPVWGIIGSGSGMVAQPAIFKEIFGNTNPPVLTFEDLLKRYNIGKVDFLKIDIEGSEFDLFKGNINWLSKVKLIAMEVHAPFTRMGTLIPCGDINEIRRVLEEAGFKVWLLDINEKIVPEIKNQTGYLYAKNLS